ncbi:MAG: hypothetical protein Q4F95_15005 [Oscillospiraceae bacterium]|nr:hypothetical protein [Oscillospiraceae bacterium]
MKKKIETKPFDRYKIPPKQNLFFMPVIWLWCWIATRKGRLKITKVRMKGLKPPYIVLGTHQAFSDFFVTPLALFPHRANYISELEGFEAYGEWLYRQAGCLGTRKFVNDIALIRNIRRVIARKGILAYYPEARYANAGTSSELPESVGKLVKLLKAPVVTINMKGNYLQSPIWNLKIRKEAQQEAVITQIYTREELEAADIPEINERISQYLSYDEYAWQFETKTAITYEKRAEGLELVLYKCPSCGAEFEMITKGADIMCRSCGFRRHMTEYGRMEEGTHAFSVRKSSDGFTHIPDWYEWERNCTKQEIDEGKYSLNVKVHIESLPNAVNFIDLSTGILRHTKDGFSLTYCEYGESQERTLSFSPSTMISVHTEYDYRGKGQCITLSTLDNTYFLFPLEPGFNVTKIQFAAEYLYKLSKSSDRINSNK